ncbi:TetR/AcrR family transcriptional regulator [Caldibacillus thermoamylovorans]
MAPRKSAEQELSREMIMDRARELFVTKGYQHVSMRQVAKELNCSHGAIYYHFKNKAELFYALVEEHFQMLDQVLDHIMNEDLHSTEKLKKIMLGFIKFGLTYQNHYEIMFLIKEEDVLDFINQGPKKSYDKFAQALSLLSDGKLSIQEIWCIFLSLHGFVTHYIRHVVSYNEVEQLAQFHVNFLLKSIL